MGDDVVKLAGDPGAFVGDGPAGSGLLLRLQAFGPFAEQRQVVATVADPAPDVPGESGEKDCGERCRCAGSCR